MSAVRRYLSSRDKPAFDERRLLELTLVELAVLLLLMLLAYFCLLSLSETRQRLLLYRTETAQQVPSMQAEPVRAWVRQPAAAATVCQCSGVAIRPTQDPGVAITVAAEPAVKAVGRKAKGYRLVHRGSPAG